MWGGIESGAVPQNHALSDGAAVGTAVAIDCSGELFCKRLGPHATSEACFCPATGVPLGRVFISVSRVQRDSVFLAFLLFEFAKGWECKVVSSNCRASKSRPQKSRALYAIGNGRVDWRQDACHF
jgi:hypothetical protein